MRFYCCFCTLWMTFSTIQTTDPPQEQRPLAFSFVFSNDGYYELEDIPALLNRNKDESEKIHHQKFYFSHMIFACPGSTKEQLAIQKNSTTGILLFFRNIILARCVSNFIYTIPVCKKKYHPTVIALKQVNGRDTVDEGNNKSNRQEFSIGYQISENLNLLKKYDLPMLKSIDGMIESWLEALKIIYDTENMVVKQVFYELHYFGESLQVPGECKHFKIGRYAKSVKDVSFKTAYNRPQQKRALSGTQRANKRAKSTSPPHTAASNTESSIVVFNQPSESEESSPEDDTGKKQPQSEPMDTDDTNDPVDAEPSQSNDYDENTVIDAQPLRMIKSECTDSNGKCCLNDLLTLQLSTLPIPVEPVDVSKKRNLEDLQPGAAPTEPSEEYFIMQQLAPIEYFDVSSIQAATCSYLNVAPMWQSLAAGAWQKIDLAIRKVLHVIDTLRIIAGTHDILTLENRLSNRPPKRIFFLTNFNQVSVPRIFYKFVVHKVFPPGNDTKPDLYAVLIVMHNQLTKPKPDEMICPQDDCATFGWDVTNDDEQTGSPYCCYPHKEILQKLDIKYPRITGVLNLNSVYENETS